MTLAVIIPVKDRLDISQCVASLISTQLVNQIVVCDGGSTDPSCVAALHNLRHSRVEVLHLPMSGFNKSWLINQGIQHINDEVLLISDADIIWNETTIEQLLALVKTKPNTIASVQHVIESDPTAVSLRRDRYTYTIHIAATETVVEIVPVQPQTSDVQELSQFSDRPGCGLICAPKSTLLTLGGYKEVFQGWGWEDQDLLIRATVLGMSIQTVGSVLHLSHQDTARNQHWGQIEPSQTRNQNILACVRSLAQGQIFGDLPATRLSSNSMVIPNPIAVRLPAALLQNRPKT
jgi:glycosyltransferase involved in cell wall biosynthesis